MLGIVGQLRDMNAGLSAFNANLIRLGTIQVEANRIMLELGTKFGELALSVDDAAGSAERGTVVGEALDALRGLTPRARRRRSR